MPWVAAAVLIQPRGQGAEVGDLVRAPVAQLHKRRRTSVVVDLNRYIFTVASNFLIRRHKKSGAGGATIRRSPEYRRTGVPERALMSKLELDPVVAALERLPPRTREIVLLQRFQKLTYTDVSKTLGISISALEKHVLRARKGLSGGRWIDE